MKYRLKLVSRYETLKEIYKITKNRNKSKYKDVQNIINKIFRLTKHLNNLKNYTSTVARIHYLVNGFSKCPECGCDVRNFTSECCSIKCANILKHKKETPENKKIRVTKAAATRDYEKIVQKRLITMSTTLDELGNNLCKLSSVKAAQTMMNTIEENGLSIAQNRAHTTAITIGVAGYKDISDKAVLTRKENGNNSSFNYWSNLSEENKIIDLNKRTNKANETKLENNSNSARTFWSSLSDDERKTEGYNRSKKVIATKIEKGILKPIEDRDAFKVYEQAAGFKHGFETKCEEQKALLKEYGVFNPNKNTKGCVRDHLLSRRYGFDNNIDPDIISHPANCEIVLHSENIRRANGDDDLITLDELLERIKNWID